MLEKKNSFIKYGHDTELNPDRKYFNNSQDTARDEYVEIVQNYRQTGKCPKATKKLYSDIA